MAVFKSLILIASLLSAGLIRADQPLMSLSLFSLTGSAQNATLQEQSEEELQLRLKRNFGYSSGTGEIQGTFTLTATASIDLSRVRFFLDGNLMAEVSAPPFQVRFKTGAYPLGEHLFEAIGTTRQGQEIRSNQIRVQFVTPEEGWQSALRIVIPILVVVGLAMALSLGLTILTGRGGRSRLPPGASRDYGFLGGAICPQCGRPFALHFYAPNLLTRKFDRCPYCGKWSLVQRAPLPELRQAEESEKQAASGIQGRAPADEEELLRKELEESRYQDL